MPKRRCPPAVRGSRRPACALAEVRCPSGTGGRPTRTPLVHLDQTAMSSPGEPCLRDRRGRMPADCRAHRCGSTPAIPKPEEAARARGELRAFSPTPRAPPPSRRRSGSSCRRWDGAVGDNAGCASPSSRASSGARPTSTAKRCAPSWRAAAVVRPRARRGHRDDLLVARPPSIASRARRCYSSEYRSCFPGIAPPWRAILSAEIPCVRCRTVEHCVPTSTRC